jgi:rubrerythrin
MSSAENLKAAFAGESQANRKYLAFAKQAEREGYPQVAKLFRAAAEAETVHALSHLKVLGEIKATAENLKAAISGEEYEFSQMYPQFISEAKVEGNEEAILSFYRANEVEKVHHQLFKKAAESLGQNPEIDYYVCQICGYTAEGEAPEKCPVCGAKKGQFKKVA